MLGFAHRSGRSTIVTATIAATATAAAIAGITGVPAAVAADAQCPAALPVADIVRDMPVHGLTVSVGTTPDTFTGSVLGVIKDGIAPGLDMIVADLDNPELERVGGIWAGMSGSPVYDDDGNLLGAVAYGLSGGPSRVAGITPAAEMYPILDEDGAAAAADSVPMPRGMQARAVEAGAASTDEAQSELHQLPLPLAVSGLNATRRADASLMARLTPAGTFAYGAAAAPAAGVVEPGSTIEPGSNLAAGLSYGDVSAIAVGTATAVCDGAILGFGHPFQFTGPATESLHGADALYVQDDPTFTPFKVANPTSPIGTVDQDRLTGIRGITDSLPTTVPVTSDITNGAHERIGRTDAVVRDFLPDIAGIHVLANIDRLISRIGEGTSESHLVITGTRGDGSQWTLDRTDRYASQFDISAETGFPVLIDALRLGQVDTEDVKIDSIDVTADITNDFHRFHISHVQYQAPNGEWVDVARRTTANVVAGQALHMRATLTPFKRIGDEVVLDLSVPVPGGTVGRHGFVDVEGGGGGGDDFFFFADGSSSTSPSFTRLLRRLQNAPRGDDVISQLTLSAVRHSSPPPIAGARVSESRITRTRTVRADEVVTGLRSFGVRVVAPRATHLAAVDGSHWSLRKPLSTGPASSSFTFGPGTGTPVEGDWDGDGGTTPGVFTDGTWHVRPSSLAADTIDVAFGANGDRPVVGDFNGDGKDDLGVVGDGAFSYRTSLSDGPADVTIDLPDAAAGAPIAGDWNGDGIDTLAFFHGGTWLLLHSNVDGTSTRLFDFGAPHGKPVSGDWNRDGVDSIGVVHRAHWSLRNHNSAGAASITLTFGKVGAAPLTWR